ncbi:MAG: radical SAM protein [Oscillospiraceae bacterium]|nr:radical SAM protein [Oscillospiraceae bacterium]
MSYKTLFDTQIAKTFKTAVKLLAATPKSAAAMLKISAHQAKAKKLRNQWLEKGVSVPPLLIVSTTDDCNLQCKECYSACREKTVPLAKERIGTLLGEASAAGCSAVLLAGGEPLLAQEWMESVAAHKELLGLVFTNGTLFDENWVDFFATHRNMIALFSVEGLPERTDDRRGSGVTDKIRAAMAEMRKRRIPFGISVTTGSHNIGEVTEEGFINPYIEAGCRLVIHVEYVPMGDNEAFLPLSPNDKHRLSEYCAQIRSDAIFIAFPGNEDEYGGCLAAGRGFVHIAASGVLEPCPFAPYSDRDLRDISFIGALQSPLLKAIRAEAGSLREGVGGCSLRGREDLLRSYL